MEKIAYKELPDVLTIKQKAKRIRIERLLGELAADKLAEAECKASIEAIQQELVDLQGELGYQGFKSGTFCFFSRQVPGKKTLNKILLMENGVSPAVIKMSMKSGKDYLEKRFKDLAQKDNDNQDEKEEDD